MNSAKILAVGSSSPRNIKSELYNDVDDTWIEIGDYPFAGKDIIMIDQDRIVTSLVLFVPGPFGIIKKLTVQCQVFKRTPVSSTKMHSLFSAVLAVANSRPLESLMLKG